MSTDRTTPCYGAIQAHNAAQGLDECEEDEMNEAIERHHQAEVSFALARFKGDWEAAQEAYDEAVSLESGPIKKHDLEAEITPIEDVENATDERLGLENLLRYIEDPEAYIRKVREDPAVAEMTTDLPCIWERWAKSCASHIRRRLFGDKEKPS